MFDSIWLFWYVNYANLHEFDLIELHVLNNEFQDDQKDLQARREVCWRFRLPRCCDSYNRKSNWIHTHIWKGKVKMRMIWMYDEWQNVWIWLLIGSQCVVQYTWYTLYIFFSFQFFFFYLFAMQSNFIVLYSNTIQAFIYIKKERIGKLPIVTTLNRKYLSHTRIIFCFVFFFFFDIKSSVAHILTHAILP